jgi:hypothetical protein
MVDIIHLNRAPMVNHNHVCGVVREYFCLDLASFLPCIWGVWKRPDDIYNILQQNSQVSNYIVQSILRWLYKCPK